METAALIVCRQQRWLAPGEFAKEVVQSVVCVVHPDFETPAARERLGAFDGPVVYRLCVLSREVVVGAAPVELEWPVPTITVGGRVFTLGTVVVRADAAVDILTHSTLRMKSSGQTRKFACRFDRTTNELRAVVHGGESFVWGDMHPTEARLATQSTEVSEKSRVVLYE